MLLWARLTHGGAFSPDALPVGWAHEDDVVVIVCRLSDDALVLNARGGLGWLCAT